MSSLVCPKCGTLSVGRSKDEDMMRTRIAELEADSRLCEVLCEEATKTIAEMSEVKQCAELAEAALSTANQLLITANEATKRAEAALAERDRMLDTLRDGLVRIIQCNNYLMTIPAIDLNTGESGPHGVDGYNCSDVLAIIHEVFPDFCKWDEDRARAQLADLRARAGEGSES